jgi:hypothetical protein
LCSAVVCLLSGCLLVIRLFACYQVVCLLSGLCSAVVCLLSGSCHINLFLCSAVVCLLSGSCHINLFLCSAVVCLLSGSCHINLFLDVRSAHQLGHTHRLRYTAYHLAEEMDPSELKETLSLPHSSSSSSSMKSSSSSSSGSVSISKTSASGGVARAENSAAHGEARRNILVAGIQADVNVLRDLIRDSGAYESRPVLHRCADVSVVTALMTKQEALDEDAPFPPRSPEHTRFRLQPPPTQRGQQFTHNVGFYNVSRSPSPIPPLPPIPTSSCHSAFRSAYYDPSRSGWGTRRRDLCRSTTLACSHERTSLDSRARMHDFFF